jgi:hypothetical protein
MLIPSAVLSLSFSYFFAANQLEEVSNLLLTLFLPPRPPPPYFPLAFDYLLPDVMRSRLALVSVHSGVVELLTANGNVVGGGEK